MKCYTGLIGKRGLRGVACIRKERAATECQTRVSQYQTKFNYFILNVLSVFHGYLMIGSVFDCSHFAVAQWLHKIPGLE